MFGQVRSVRNVYQNVPETSLTSEIINQLAQLPTSPNDINSTEWGYLASLNQALDTSQTPTWVGVNTGNITTSGNTIGTSSGDLNLSASSGDVLLAQDPDSALGAATKQYVDASITGFASTKSANLKTVGALDTYTQSGTGVGATLTATANGALTVDGVSPTTSYTVLVDDNGSTSSTHNGIYDVTQVGDGSNPWILTRLGTYDENSEITPGSRVYITEGSTTAEKGYILSSDSIDVDVLALNYTQVSGGAQSGLNVGSGDGWYKGLNGKDLEFKSILASGSVLGITNNTNDLTLTFTQGNITGLGVVDSGSITSNFGNIDIGTSTIDCGQITTSDNVIFTGAQNIVIANEDVDTSNQEAIIISDSLESGYTLPSGSRITMIANTSAVAGIPAYSATNAFHTCIGWNPPGAISGSFSGDEITTMGVNCMRLATSGDCSVVIGTNPANNITALDTSVIIGARALQDSTGSPANCVAIGFYAGNLMTSDNNTLVGTRAGDQITSGGNNTMFGHFTDVSAGTVSNCIGVGYSITNVGTNEIVIGNASNTVMRSMGDNICDLGSNSFHYKKLWVQEVRCADIDIIDSSITFSGTTGMNVVTFPTNLADGYKLSDGTSDFIDLVSTTGSKNITLGQNTHIVGNLTITGTVDGRDIASDGSTIDTMTTIGLDNLTTAEVSQLGNINSTTVSTTQWGYLGAMDQGITTTSTPTFAQLDVDNLRLNSNTITTTSSDLILSSTSGEILLIADGTQALSLVTKGYVDSIAAGTTPHREVRVKTAASLPAYTQSGSKTTAKFTADANGALTIDGVTVATNDRVLVSEAASDIHNGIYVVTDTGDGSNPWILDRATTEDENVELPGGSFFFVTDGTANSDTGWVIDTNSTDLDVSSLSFAQFSGAGTATASNVGSGSHVFKQKTGHNLEFRSVLAGSTKISLTENTNDLSIDLVQTNITGTGALDAGSITSNFGNIDIDGSTLSCGNTTITGSLTFDDVSGNNLLQIPDNQAEAFGIREGANDYITFVTTNGSETVNLCKDTDVTGHISSTSFICATNFTTISTNVEILGSSDTVAQITSGGGNNVFVGEQAGSDKSADGNVFVGALAGNGTVAGLSYAIGIGDEAMRYYNGTDPRRIGIGNRSCGGRVSGGSAGIDNIGIGFECLANISTGTNNVYIANYNGNLCDQATGDSNVIIGGDGVAQFLTNDSNVVVGSAAGKTMISASSNVILGAGADVEIGTTLRSVAVGGNAIAATDSIAIGYGAEAATDSVVLGSGSTTTGTNTIIIGENIDTTTNNEIVIGNSTKIRIRPDSNDLMDIGSATYSYHAIYSHAGTIRTVQTLTGTSPVNSDNSGIIYKTSGGNQTVTIRTVDWVVGRTITIINDNGSGGTLTIATEGSQTIDGQATESINDDQTAYFTIVNSTKAYQTKDGNN